MVRKKKSAPNTVRIYRHFAVVTVLVTAAVALMAGGDSRQQAIETVEKEQQRAQTRAKENAMFQSGALVDNSNSREIQGEFGDDGWTGFAGPTTSVPASSGSIAANDPPWVRLGMTQQDWAALSREQQDRLLASLPPDAATLARISEESLRRAGFEGDGSDAPSDGY